MGDTNCVLGQEVGPLIGCHVTWDSVLWLKHSVSLQTGILPEHL